MAMRPPTLNKIGTTSMHSSRMRTALFGGRHYMSVPGGSLSGRGLHQGGSLGGIFLRDFCPGGSLSRAETPSDCEQNHRQVQKHYLPAFSLAGGKKLPLVFYTLGIKCMAYNLIWFKAYS